jgi:hypothetical protein
MGIPHFKYTHFRIKNMDTNNKYKIFTINNYYKKILQNNMTEFMRALAISELKIWQLIINIKFLQ